MEGKKLFRTATSILETDAQIIDAYLYNDLFTAGYVGSSVWTVKGKNALILDNNTHYRHEYVWKIRIEEKFKGKITPCRTVYIYITGTSVCGQYALGTKYSLRDYIHPLQALHARVCMCGNMWIIHCTIFH